MLTLTALVPLLLLTPQGPLDVQVTPRGDEPILATWSIKAIGIETDFGSAEVAAEHLAQIHFGDDDQPDVVLTCGGVELQGQVSLRRLDLKVAGKSTRLSTAKLDSVLVLRDGQAIGVAAFDGEWMTSFGPCTLQQRGATVEGSYGFDDGGRIEGKVTDGVLEFTFATDSSSGKGRFERLTEHAFTGTFGKDERFWGGYRKREQSAAMTPGKITSGQTKDGMRYHVHLPAAHDAGSSAGSSGAAGRWPAICILHGSNMSSLAYVNTIVSAWPDLAERYAIVGLDGERLSSASTKDELRFNYTYINFSGDGVGPAWVHRQSPALVADALRELSDELPVTRWFLGGHSQGGFLTYCLVMFYPELLAGAFPMSCNLLVQCEPDNFDGAKRIAQHEVPVAVIHGQADNVVKFSGGAYCHTRLLDGDFPGVRLFAPRRVGHQFALLPVDDAITWLEQLSSEDTATLVGFAEARAKAKAWRDVGAALLRVDANSPGPLRSRIRNLTEQLQQAAEAQATQLSAAIGRSQDGSWVDDFLAFRADFATAEAAEPVLAAYAKLREQQQDEGDELFAKARRMRDKADREAVYAQILERCYATKWYASVKLWMK